MANGKPQASNRRTTQGGAGNLRDQFGTAAFQVLGAAPDPGSPWQFDQFASAGGAVNIALGQVDPTRVGVGSDVNQRKIDQVFADQKRQLDQFGLSIEELNTPVLKPDGTPFTAGQGDTQLPVVLGDLLIGLAGVADDEVARDAQRAAIQAKQSGAPLQRLVLDKFSGPVDRLVGVNSSGQSALINQQTNRGSQLGDILDIAVPAAGLAAIGGLGAFGPGGFLAGGGAAAPTAAAPAAPTVASVAGPTAGSVVPTAITNTVAPAAGGVAGGLASSIAGPAIAAGGSLAGGLIAANAAQSAGETAADAQLQAAETSAQLQRDLLAQAQTEQLRQEERAEPFRQAALSALPGLQEVAGRELPQVNIDPNLFANLPGVPQFQGPNLDQLRTSIGQLGTPSDFSDVRAAIEQLNAPTSFDLSPAGQAAVDIGTEIAQRQAAATGFSGSWNLLAELQQIGTREANLDFLRQQQLDQQRAGAQIGALSDLARLQTGSEQQRIAAQIDALGSLAQLEAGSEQDRINSAILQRELARQSALDPLTLQLQQRQLESENITSLFNRLGSLSGLAPGQPQVFASTLPQAANIGLGAAGFQSQAGQAQAAGQFGAANTLAQTANNLGSILGQTVANRQFFPQAQQPQAAAFPQASINNLVPTTGRDVFNQQVSSAFNVPRPQGVFL